MGKIHLTTNVNLQNYAKRIGIIAKCMNPEGIEFFSLPQNYAKGWQFCLPERHVMSEKFPLLNRETARNMGTLCKEYGIKKIQYHYPYTKTLLESGGHDIALTMKFCDIVLEKSGAEELTINYHNVLKYPPPSFLKKLGGMERKNIIAMLQTQSRLASQIKEALDSRCLLVIENNPAASFQEDKKTREMIIDNVDLVPEDFINRRGIDGTTLDYSHAWTVVGAMNGTRKMPNMEWCKRHYGKIPRSSKTMDAFVKKVAPRIKWIHLSDESTPYNHSGQHIGKGKVDFEECARLFKKHAHGKTPATIEVSDGHKPDGFRQILKNDFPVLSQIFGN